MSSHSFKVIVVGGGPAGLTAAHALQLAGIDFVVLERRTNIIEDLGASLVLGPPSLRVMHQFGILGDLLGVGHEIIRNRSFDSDGNVLHESTEILRLRKNHGLAPVAFHRAQLVETLYNGLPDSAKDKVLLGKKLSDIQPDEKGVSVTCEDGSSYHGSVVLGVDGVHSKTRQLMRKLALESNSPGDWDAEKPFASSYRCMWCSFPRPSEPGDAFDTQHKDKSVMYLAGRERGWIFLYEKLPETTRERASYTDADMQTYIDKFKDFPVTDNLKVQDVWEKRFTAGMANLEEGIAGHWSWGRIVLAGDAAHKFTPNAGLGLNTAIQDIVSLCNGLWSLKRTFAKRLTSSDEELSQLTTFFETYGRERKALISGDASRSALVTRTHAWANPLYYFLAQYVLSAKIVESFMLEFLAKRSMKKALVLNYVNVDEPMVGAVEWDHPLVGAAKAR
ncbi:uncharacterized protein F5Z01DRAFT_548997 [Emericellopsis atlantica]|uniref:FAD-binding domain-containing protein n=1 Tax=Emericellopsis atlantica TaxID=2614577 RepID=A0A9P7ZNX1_9HYPO|nr:uncharacterized protein F5Z01DRAFT_548997 [Emericellopsis atlantica]KAG9255589.1 hypothetical protein F5Z01DRAFT_548997 [Emericellopsis atlantica]